MPANITVTEVLCGGGCGARLLVTIFGPVDFSVYCLKCHQIPSFRPVDPDKAPKAAL